MASLVHVSSGHMLFADPFGSGVGVNPGMGEGGKLHGIDPSS